MATNEELLAQLLADQRSDRRSDQRSSQWKGFAQGTLIAALVLLTLWYGRLFSIEPVTPTATPVQPQVTAAIAAQPTPLSFTHFATAVPVVQPRAVQAQVQAPVVQAPVVQPIATQVPVVQAEQPLPQPQQAVNAVGEPAVNTEAIGEPVQSEGYHTPNLTDEQAHQESWNIVNDYRRACEDHNSDPCKQLNARLEDAFKN